MLRRFLVDVRRYPSDFTEIGNNGHVQVERESQSYESDQRYRRFKVSRQSYE